MKGRQIGLLFLAFALFVLSGCQVHEHVYGEWEVKTEATCTAEGTEIRSCECGESETRQIAATGHTFGDWIISTIATCTTEGVETRTCECGESETRKISIEHTFGEWVTITAATCTTEGVETRTCECGESETKQIATTEHPFGEWVTITAATCTTEGVETRTCECGESVTRQIATTEHPFGEWVTITAATCTTAGEETRTCVCGVKETQAVSATGHDYAAANCKAPKTCVVCGATEGQIGGHTYSNATCTKPKTCSVCGATEGSTIAHEYSNGTCTMCGTKEPHLQQQADAATAYTWLIKAEEGCDFISNTIYKAWYFAIYEADGAVNGTVAMNAFANKLGFSTDVVQAGIISYLEREGMEWPEDDDTYMQNIYREVALGSNAGAVYVAQYALRQYSYYSSAQGALDAAKELIRGLDREYASVNAYTELSSYYSAIVPYFDFCKSPSGSFSTLSDTLNNYRTNCSTYRSMCSLYF